MHHEYGRLTLATAGLLLQAGYHSCCSVNSGKSNTWWNDKTTMKVSTHGQPCTLPDAMPGQEVLLNTLTGSGHAHICSVLQNRNSRQCTRLCTMAAML